ncbi:MAG: GIY-YIG nuclease family protein [Candidatus Aenigmatarchaeota archaeon]
MFYVYVLSCSDGSLYTGYTNDVSKRLEQHQQGKAAKYTKGRRPVKLVLSLEYSSKSEALRAEAAFKKLSRQEKLRHIGHLKKSFKYLDKK